MKDKELIFKPIKEEMANFEPFFKEQLKSGIPLLSVITNYVLRRKGKQMRPMLVFLAAKLNGPANPNSYIAATLIELLHTATLIHDDVVDETYQRRGFFSINALWKSKVAVLVGDYFLSKGLLTALDNDQIGILKIVSHAVKEISEGELLQIEKSRFLNITEEIYFEVIRKKTATLIAACTAAGAHSVDASIEKIEIMKEFGTMLGIAFQMRDDLFDYEKTNLIGKPTGNDIKEKKMTLPLIYTLSQLPKSESKALLRKIRRHHKNEIKVSEIIDVVRKGGGIEYTFNKMVEYKEKALTCLAVYPESDAKIALISLVNYTVSRNK